MAYIEERTDSKGNKRYRAQIRIKGQAPVTATFDRKTDAKRWVQETEPALRNGKYFNVAESKRHTVKELIERYEKKVLPELKSGKDRKNHLIYWKDKLGNLALSDITPAKIVECRDDLSQGNTRRNTKRSNSTVNRYLATLSHAFSIAVMEWGWIDENPCRRVSTLKEPRGRVRYLEDDERKTLLEQCKEKSETLYTIVVIALSTGARRGEILSLRWNEVNLNKGVITMHETKNNEIRSVPLQGLALELVKQLSKVRRLDTDLLFPAKDNADKPISIDSSWQEAVKAAGIENFRFHDLRHCAASYLAMNGASIAELAEVLGHKTLQMVKRYSHLTEQHTTSIVAKMNNKIFEQS